MGNPNMDMDQQLEKELQKVCDLEEQLGVSKRKVTEIEEELAKKVKLEREQEREQERELVERSRCALEELGGVVAVHCGKSPLLGIVVLVRFGNGMETDFIASDYPQNTHLHIFAAEKEEGAGEY